MLVPKSSKCYNVSIVKVSDRFGLKKLRIVLPIRCSLLYFSTS